ncbi:hypothetical protein [Tropicibacter sp. Alg240-R139]|uniref:hypothetical protein n=1 Tax=Tropicibacter sp. Alg240-R139 TaxID=2305991 RepID=UPI0013DEEA82|nr:hypothetical protein [Tropicibacter sp. Alg240-R139]
MLDRKRIDVPLMPGTVAASSVGRKMAIRAAFKKHCDLVKPSMMLSIKGGRDTPIPEKQPNAPVIPDFRTHRTAR